MVANLGYQSELDRHRHRPRQHGGPLVQPDTGQFDTRDSVDISAVPGSIAANRFQYGDGNPLTVTDPTGHWGLSSLWNGAVSVYNTVKTAVSTPATG